jgi:hypothetical protein
MRAFQRPNKARKIPGAEGWVDRMDQNGRMAQQDRTEAKIKERIGTDKEIRGKIERTIDIVPSSQERLDRKSQDELKEIAKEAGINKDDIQEIRVHDNRLAVKLTEKCDAQEVVKKNEGRRVGNQAAVSSLEKWCGIVLYGMNTKTWGGEGGMEKLKEFLDKE